MNLWQKYWLISAIIIYGVHLVRDVMQDLGIKNFLSESLVKKNKPDLLIFHPSNTYITAIVVIALSVYALRSDTFGVAGVLTIVITISTIIGFLVYWFLY